MSNENEVDNDQVKKMNPEIKAKWLEALRSGNYKQAKLKLKSRAGGYCCLGVLCDLYIKENPESKFVYGAHDKLTWANPKKFYQMPNHASQTVPLYVQAWAELEDENPTIDGNDLSEWNDNEGKNFSEIADMIEKEL